MSYLLGPQRLFAGTVSLQRGSFYSGDKTTVGFNRGRLELTPQFSSNPACHTTGLTSQRAPSRPTS